MKFAVYCGLTEGRVEVDAAMLLAKARELAQGDKVTAIVIGAECNAESLRGADQVLWCREEGRAQKKGEILAQMLRKDAQDVVLFPARGECSHIASHAAALMETGLCADCTALRMEGSEFIMHRPAFGGGVEADIVCPAHTPRMATVRPGIFGKMEIQSDADVPQVVEFAAQDVAAEVIRRIAAVEKPPSEDLTSAEVIVAGGAGVGSKEGFVLLQQLADKLGGKVGATRAAVDAGYAAWEQQIGQTGLMVQPRVYLAFGISGAIQHVAGMHGSTLIVSVNSDPKAAIFSYSDVAIVGDWREVALRMIEAVDAMAK